MHGPLEALGKRIGRNREYAGVHYPSDTETSWKLADAVFEVLTNPTRVPEFTKLVELAKQEWQ
jgi:acid phosphatase (class A)